MGLCKSSRATWCVTGMTCNRTRCRESSFSTPTKFGTQRQLQPAPGMQQARMPAQMMKMTPEIYIVLDVRGVTNENVGKDLNTARLASLEHDHGG
jgi:hypothetical protein